MPACARICPPLAITETCHMKSRQEGANSEPYLLWGPNSSPPRKAMILNSHLLYASKVVKYSGYST